MRRFFPIAALLGVAFVLGCQDVGTGVVASDGPGPQFAKPGVCNPPQDPPHPSCKPPDEDPPEVPTFTVKVTGDIFSTNDAGGLDVLYDATGGTVRVNGFQLQLSGDMLDLVTCAVGDDLDDLPDPLIGTFQIWNFLNDYISLSFEHNFADHWFSSSSVELPDSWPPTTVGQEVTVRSLLPPGEWGLQTTGKNHRDGCTGEGVGISWEAIVTRVG